MNIKHNYFQNLLLNTKRFVFMAAETPSGADADMSMSPAQSIEPPEVKMDFKAKALELREASLVDELPETHCSEGLQGIKSFADASRKTIEDYKKDPNANQEWATAQLVEIGKAEDEALRDYKLQWDAYKEKLAEKRKALTATTTQLLKEAGKGALSKASANVSLSKLKEIDPQWFEEHDLEIQQSLNELLDEQESLKVSEEKMKEIEQTFTDGSDDFKDITWDTSYSLSGSDNELWGISEGGTEEIARSIAVAAYTTSEENYQNYLNKCKKSVDGGDNITLSGFVNAASPESKTSTFDAQETMDRLLRERHNYRGKYTLSNTGYAFGSLAQAETVFENDPEGLQLYKDYCQSTFTRSMKENLDLKTILASPKTFQENLAKAVSELHPANLNENTPKNAEFLTDLLTGVKDARELWKTGNENLGLVAEKFNDIDEAQLATIVMLSSLPALGTIDLSKTDSAIALKKSVDDLRVKVLERLANTAEDEKNASIDDLKGSDAGKKAAEWEDKIKQDRSILEKADSTVSADIKEKYSALNQAALNLQAFTLPVGQDFDINELKKLPLAISEVKTKLEELSTALDKLTPTPEAAQPKAKARPKRTPSPTREDEPVASTTAPTSAPAQAAPEAPKAEPSTATTEPEAPVKEARFIDSKEDVKTTKIDADGNISSEEKARITAATPPAAPAEKTSTLKDIANAPRPKEESVDVKTADGNPKMAKNGKKSDSEPKYAGK